MNMTPHDVELAQNPPQAAGSRPPILVGDHPALDFVNTLAFPDGDPIEWLTDVDAVRRWQAETKMCGGVETGPISLPDPIGLVRQLVALREWLRGYLFDYRGSSARERALADTSLLNDLLRRDCSYRQLEVVGGVLTWSADRRRDAARALIQPIFHAVGDFVSEADFTRVRKCEADDCTLWFLDTTKSGKRRWCSMSICGNRAKARAHRARQRSP